MNGAGAVATRAQLTGDPPALRTEVLAGVTTFVTMAYIVFVQPAVLGAAGMDPGAVLMATCLASAFATVLMGWLANYPIAVAPAMGHNFFFAYTVVLASGTPWPVALGAVAIAGGIFVLTAGIGLREHIIAAVDIILNRDLSTLQSLIDQFKELQGIKYIYIVDERGDWLAHTFVPGIPREIQAAARVPGATVERQLPGFGEFVEVSSPILDGIAGSVHVGMDKGFIALKIQTAIGQQIYLISIIFIVSIIGSYLLVNLAAKPIVHLGGYATHLVAPDAPHALKPAEALALLERADEVGQLARIYRHLALRANGTDLAP